MDKPESTQEAPAPHSQCNEGARSREETSEHDAEFRIALYNKLWENIIHKENRLWTFLSLFAIAIGIVIGTGSTGTPRVETAVGFILLAYWAIELIMDSEWWSVRNRRMIEGVEAHFHVKASGVIPSHYYSPYFSGESLHGVSLFVFSSLAIMAYLMTSGLFRLPGWDGSSLDLGEQLFLFVLLTLLAARCGHRREKIIAGHFKDLRDLNEQQKDAEWSSRCTYEEENIEKAESTDRERLNWRLYILLTFILSSWITGFELAVHAFDADPESYSSCRCYLPFWLFVSFQIPLFFVYMFAWSFFHSHALYGFGVLPPEGCDRNGTKTNSTSLREWLAQRPFLLNQVMLALLVLSVLTVGYVAKFHCT